MKNEFLDNRIVPKITLGVPYCDNTIAYYIDHLDYTLQNPCYEIRSYHIHHSNYVYIMILFIII